MLDCCALLLIAASRSSISILLDCVSNNLSLSTGLSDLIELSILSKLLSSSFVFLSGSSSLKLSPVLTALIRSSKLLDAIFLFFLSAILFLRSFIIFLASLCKKVLVLPSATLRGKSLLTFADFDKNNSVSFQTSPLERLDAISGPRRSSRLCLYFIISSGFLLSIFIDFVFAFVLPLRGAAATTLHKRHVPMGSYFQFLLMSIYGTALKQS